jgi:alpha-1,3-glucosyltransferase
MEKEASPLVPLPKSLTLVIFGFAILLRILVGFSHHSGQDNFHGNKQGYGGDYEAQRHWMEITYHLPIGDWYYYDLEYWGLDYPPLTAYVSYICGWASHHIVGEHTVSLDTSRGIEDPTHKTFMRTTVLFLDLLFYGSSVWYSSFQRDHKSLWAILIALCQPAILLIDHGHFQYNTVALGLSISAFSYMVRENFLSCIYGSFLYCLALNFKQMTLYYVPAVFFYLLGRCMAKPSRFFLRFLLLGVTVIFTFWFLWTPFLKYGPSQTENTPLDRAKQILLRIFPFERGLFEGKVANIWCALNTRPFSIRDRINIDLQPIVALALTMGMVAPSCYCMALLGMQDLATADRRTEEKHWMLFLWGTASCSLGFFLASFQVHEKSILLVLAPMTLLFWQDASFVEWFSIACAWSLWPLLQVDRLQVPYTCMMSIFVALIWFRRTAQPRTEMPTVFSGTLSLVANITYLVMIGLHATEMFLEAPIRFPDLYPLLWSTFGCAMFNLAWLITCWKLLKMDYNHATIVNSKKVKKKI